MLTPFLDPEFHDFRDFVEGLAEGVRNLKYPENPEIRDSGPENKEIRGSPGGCLGGVIFSFILGRLNGMA